MRVLLVDLLHGSDIGWVQSTLTLVVYCSRVKPLVLKLSILVNLGGLDEQVIWWIWHFLGFQIGIGSLLMVDILWQQLKLLLGWGVHVLGRLGVHAIYGHILG